MQDDERRPPTARPPAGGEGAASSAQPPPPRSSSPRRTTWREGAIQIGLLPVAAAVLVGIMAGVGAFTFGYGKGFSYLLNDPQACANCHVMDGHLESWQKSSHARVATCNDCHLPHHPIGKWVVKSDNGFFHSLAFTLENFHEPIQIKPRNRRVTQGTCLYCHGDFVHSLLPATEGGDMLLCMHCHDDVGHAQK